MRWKIITVAVFAAVAGLNVAHGQTIAQIGSPAEQPPAGFKGDQFIDSRGCVFMRISSGGNMGWYPRVNKNHKVVCGMPPTFGAKPVIEMADAAPAPQPVPATKPAASVVVPTQPAAVPLPAVAPVVRYAPAKPTTTVASQMVPTAAPVVVPVAVAPQPAPYVAVAPARYQVTTSNGIPPGKIGCFRSAPVAEVVLLRDGGTAVVCTRGDGTATGWRSPIYPNNAPVGAALSGGSAVRPAVVAHTVAAPVAVAAVAPLTYTVPKGYKLAWDDDRLNPMRGVGTATGQAQQDQIWTKTVPAKLIAEGYSAQAANAPVYVTTRKKAASTLTVASMNAPTAPAVAAKPAKAAKAAKAAPAGNLWVQVGSFGVPANAQSASDRLANLGLSVGKSGITKGGKALQIVFAGPFSSAAEAQSAVTLVRKAGFSDAFIR